MRNNRKLIYALLLLLLILVSAVFLITRENRKTSLQVVFLDVGQGDSILISEGSQQILIDGGKDGKILLEKLGKYIPFWDREIETVIETHPDADHIGGLIEVLNAYKVDSVLETKMQSDSQTFKKLEEIIASNKIEKIEAKKDVAIKFPGGSAAEVLYPFGAVEDIKGADTNMYSVVMKLAVGKSKFLFTGDLPMDQEKELIAKNIDISADFLKVAHHGSKYSTSQQFLDAVNPRDAIISVGKNNSYGHPNQDVLQRLIEDRINIFRTDEIGDIVYSCSGFSEKCVRVQN